MSGHRHTHSHRCRRHAAQDAAAAARAAPPAPPSTWGESAVHLLKQWGMTLAMGTALGAGNLIVAFLWGRYVSGTIPPGSYVPATTAGHLTGKVQTKNTATGEVGQATVTIAPVDVAEQNISAVKDAVGAGVAHAVSRTD